MVLLPLWVAAATLLGLRAAAGRQASKEQQIQIELPKSRPRPYGLVIPISTNADGSYISNILSASHQRRSTREVSQSPKQLYFNVTAFGREFHLRLKPNTHLVAPEAVVEWYEDSVETGNGNDAGNTSQTRTATERLWKREPLWTNCAYVGDITDIPGASVAISNCDGLVVLEAHANFLSACSRMVKWGNLRPLCLLYIVKRVVLRVSTLLYASCFQG
uniref:ADAM metallopeptidase with thrombospondin type 1 motif 3 n=1 Tax=Cairina moschata TaxID=8855 RepID=A0A8C3BNB9_CAIMO